MRDYNVTYQITFSIIFTKIDFMIVSNLYFIVTLTMIHFSFLLQTFFQPKYLGNNTIWAAEIFLKIEKLTTVEKIFKKC